MPRRHMCENLFEVSSGVTQRVTFYIFIVWICHFKLRNCNFLQRAKDNESMTKNLLQLTAVQVDGGKGKVQLLLLLLRAC